MTTSFYQKLKNKKAIETISNKDHEHRVCATEMLKDHAMHSVRDTPGLEYAGSAVVHYYYNKFEQHKLSVVLHTVTEKLGESAASVGLSLLADKLKQIYRG